MSSQAHIGLLYRREQKTESWDDDFDIDDDQFRPPPLQIRSAPALPNVQLPRSNVSVNANPLLPRRKSSLSYSSVFHTSVSRAVSTSTSALASITNRTKRSSLTSTKRNNIDLDIKYEDHLVDTLNTHANISNMVPEEIHEHGFDQQDSIEINNDDIDWTESPPQEEVTPEVTPPEPPPPSPPPPPPPRRRRRRTTSRFSIPDGILSLQTKLRGNLDSIRRLASILDDLQRIYSQGRKPHMDERDWNWCECIVKVQESEKYDEIKIKKSPSKKFDILSPISWFQQKQRIKKSWMEMMQAATKDSRPPTDFDKLEMDQVPGLVEVLENLYSRLNCSDK